MSAAVAPVSLPATWPRVIGRMSGLPECLALALLVHLLLIALLGSTPGGSARPGEGVWGRLNIRIAGSGPARIEPPAPPSPDAYSGPKGQAEGRRWGGTVRQTVPTAPQADEPGASRLGTWNPAPTTQVADPLPPQPGPLPVTEDHPAPAPAPALRELRDTETATPAPVAAALPPAPAPLPDAPTVAPPPELGTVPAAPATRALAAPAPALAENARPLARVAPVQAVAQPAPAPELRAPGLSETRTLAAPQALPAPAAPLARVQPAEAPALTPPPPALPDWRAPPAATTPSVAPPRIGEGTPRAATGAPDAGAAIGHDVATAPSEPASAPRLNLDLPRPRGGEISSQGTRGIANVLPHPPERKSKLAEDIDKAARADCRNAYGGMGVLAVVPLAVDAVRKDGCRW